MPESGIGQFCFLIGMCIPIFNIIIGAIWLGWSGFWAGLVITLFAGGATR